MTCKQSYLAEKSRKDKNDKIKDLETEVRTLKKQLLEMADWLLEAFEDLKNDDGYCSVSDGPIEQRTRAIKKDLEPGHE